MAKWELGNSGPQLSSQNSSLSEMHEFPENIRVMDRNPRPGATENMEPRKKKSLKNVELSHEKTPVGCSI